MTTEDIVGSSFLTKLWGECVVLEYQGANKVLVGFSGLHPYQTYTTMQNLRTGSVKNRLAPSVFGVGYIGCGSYKAREDGKPTKSYIAWSGMMERCYSDRLHEEHPTYKDCLVHPDWHDFQVFAEWYVNQDFYGLGYHLDKDLLTFNNKVYSEDTCCMLPPEVNKFLLSNEKFRGNLPQGVSYSKRRNNYISQLGQGGTTKFLGYFDTPEEAYSCYEIAKESRAKQLAQDWVGRVSEEVYRALMYWKVKKESL